MGKKGRRGKPNRKGTVPQQNSQRTAARTQAASYKTQGPAFQTHTGQSILLPFVTDSLVATVLERGGIPEHLNSFETLKAYLEKIFTANGNLANFFEALAQGLEAGPPQIDQSVQLIRQWSQKMPLLHWVCQFRFLNCKLGCNLTEDVVKLVLRAGANPNATLPSNQTSAIFFAVKYANVKSVDMLLQAGANIQQKDVFGRSCLYNALEYPNPLIIRRLLEHLPATEMFPSSTPDGEEEFLISTADTLLSFVTAENSPIPWTNLGDPSVNDLQEAFILIRQQGARLTERASSYPLAVIGYSFTAAQHPLIRKPEMLQQLAKVLVGVHIPENCKPDKETSISTERLEEMEEDEEPYECPMCLEVSKKLITLYCGHTYCRSCIVEYGKKQTNNGCPLCRSQLCREVSFNSRGNVLSFHHVMGINEEASKRQGPKYFTNEQLAAEAKAQGLYSSFSSYASLRSKIETELTNGVRTSKQIQPIQMNNVRDTRTGRQSGNLHGRGRFRMELASNVPLVLGTPPSIFSLCPHDGPVGIEISICGTPLLARISSQSIYTVFSKSVVDQLGLKRIEKLKSRKFVDTNTAKFVKNSTFTCLEPMKLCFQGIEVTLRNAIEISPDPSSLLFGVQLGHDFLYSGLLSVADVKVGEGDGLFYRVVGEDSWPTSNHTSKESFRYYSHDGKMADLPLIHFNPFGRGTILGISLRENVSFKQCNWCCRAFPEGMLECLRCPGYYYCDERCQRAAWKIHKQVCGVTATD